MSHKNVLIIGSGYGASVTALRLCEAGIPCTILEMGLDWTKPDRKFSSMLNPGKSAAWLSNSSIAPFMNGFALKKFTSALDRVAYGKQKIWLGRGVGGGSLVNGGMAVRPKKDYFKQIFPELDSDSFYDKYFPLAEKELHVNHISEEYYNNSEYYKFARRGVKEAEKVGYKTEFIPNVYDFDYMEKEEKDEVLKSALAGEVIYGNNHGKMSLNKTYLKKALDTGLLNIKELHHVQSIANDGDGYELAVNVINTKGEVEEPKTMSCSHVFVCGGSVGSSELLLKSMADTKLTIENKSIGERWGNNGNVMAGRNFVIGGTGIKQSTIPIVAIDNWDDSENAFFAEISPFPFKMEVWMALYLIINKVPHLGKFVYKDGLQLDWDEKYRKKMRKNTYDFIEKMNKTNHGTPTYLLFPKGVSENICYHPLGGVTLNHSTDNYGRLKSVENLYVIDSSLIPGSVGVNPFLTITALAEYCLENLLKTDFKNPEEFK